MLVNGLKRVEDISEFDETYNKENIGGYFLNVDVQYPEWWFTIYNFCPKE